MKLGALSLHGNREGARAVQIGDSQAIRNGAAESARLSRAKPPVQVQILSVYPKLVLRFRGVESRK